ncbi:MAG TPA: TMEM175 family protein [Streptosporangiaceae bacterium]
MTDGEQPEPGDASPPAEAPDAGLTENQLAPSQDAGDETGERHHPGGRRGASTYSLARAGYIEYDRVVFFSDAIFAIAITLLAVELRHPLGKVSTGQAGLFDGGVANGLVGFGISFAVIGLFWLGHHSLFRYIVALDRPLIGLNLVFLGTIAFLPYPTLVLADYGNRSSIVVFYAVAAAVAGLAEGAVWVYATSRPELVDPSAQSVRLLFTLRTARIPVVFGLSIPVALVAPRLAQYLWILILVFGLAINRLVPPPERPARTSRRQS